MGESVETGGEDVMRVEGSWWMVRWALVWSRFHFMWQQQSGATRWLQPSTAAT